MKTVRTVRELRAALEPLRSQAGVGLVPTMGALHEGHFALLATARSECAVVVASLFVNPAQFGEKGDLASYPRDETQDRERAASAGVDFLFAPSVEELYPPGYETWVDVEPLGSVLEGRHRPGHFRGVATVCLKLFNIVRPERAYFGQKDAQQVAVVKRMVADLNLEVEIRVVATVRDPDGLALSSRNRHLTVSQRSAALALPRALEAGRLAFQQGSDPLEAARGLLAGLETDYVEVARLDGRLVLAAAVRVGDTRLIDNIVLSPEGAAA